MFPRKTVSAPGVPYGTEDSIPRRPLGQKGRSAHARRSTDWQSVLRQWITSSFGRRSGEPQSDVLDKTRGNERRRPGSVLEGCAVHGATRTGVNPFRPVGA